MCCCGKPIVNGERGYRWQPNDAPSVRPVNPPTVDNGDTILWDEPGRCGGLDAHSYHFLIVRKSGSAALYLYVRHGGGDEHFRLSGSTMVDAALGMLNSTDRYWLLHAMYHAHSDAKITAKAEANFRWRTAAAEKRIKTRKIKGGVKVWIEPPAQALPAAV